MTRMDLGRRFSRGRVAFRSRLGRKCCSAIRSAVSIISNLPLGVARLMTPLRVSLQWSWYLVSLMGDVWSWGLTGKRLAGFERSAE